MSSSASSARHINPPELVTPPGYSHVVEVGPGRTIYTSGQIAIDAKGNVVGAGDMRAQIEQVFSNVRAALAAAGTDFAHVIKLTIFMTDVRPETLTSFREVRDRYIDVKRAPASSLVQVSRLVRPELLVEMEAIAYVP
ncbi:RidA family protein [Pendulispora brunnea]|uniref:RidA family protein n=1 Tax=Pendulispora brunnea TaxID=2905690 RepID=A0ABZ2K8Y2_9BACT